VAGIAGAGQVASGSFVHELCEVVHRPGPPGLVDGWPGEVGQPFDDEVFDEVVEVEMSAWEADGFFGVL